MLLTLRNFFVFTLLSYAASQTVSYRLPEYARPIRYVLNLETNLQTFTFNGIVTIDIVMLQTSNTIVLHSKDLAITQLFVFNGTNNITAYQHFDTTRDFLNITLAQALPANSSASIYIQYNGTLGTGNVGYYRASYVNELNQTRYLAVTHLEATNARRAFPCFDQPNYKATFQINLIRNSELRTASNMKLTSTSTLPGSRLQDTYSISVEMSTYLVAFMVSDYNSIQVIYNNVTYRTFGRNELIQRSDGNYSLLVAPRAIQAMESFTNISYALNTMDQVPVPNEYYKIGAMENWGMVTYREKYLMYNEQFTSASEKQFITTIISHEFAHQWFGNLVTPEWWRYIWLNEGFATYFEMYITSQLEPTWQLMEQFVTSMVQRAFNDDALESTRPMTRDAESPAQIDAQYDTIVYEKAGSVIRMAANFLGQTVFRNGLHTYLSTWKFRNVNPTMLYSTLQTALNTTLNVSSIMASWEMQSGYPVVTVTRLSNGTIILNQQRFLLNKAFHNDTTLWQIPLNWFTINSTTNAITWFNTQNGSINPNVNLQQWIIFNINQMGFYRVNYDAANWQLITNFLRTGNYSTISVINRAQLIDDSFNLARSRRLNFTVALDIGFYIQNETEYVPIVTFTSAFSHLDRLSTGHVHHAAIETYGRTILEGYFNRSGFIQQNDTHLSKLTKVTVLTWLCQLEHMACRQNSRQVFENWVSQSTVIQADSQSYIFCNGIRDSNETSWNVTLQRYSLLREATQRTRIAQGLGCSSNPALLERLLSLVIANNSVFSPSDRVAVVTSVYTNNGVGGVNLVLQWLTGYFTLVNERVGSVSNIITGLANRITTNGQLSLFSNFINTNAGNFTTTINSTVQNAFSSAEFNLEWINTTASEFETHFTDGATSVYGSIILTIICIFVQYFYI